MPHKTANDRFALAFGTEACVCVDLAGGWRDTSGVSGTQWLRGATCEMGQLHKLTQLCASGGDDGHMGD